MNTPKTKTGFSLVELMLVAVAMGILALTFGSMIYFSYKGWRQNLAAVDLQRTGYAAMRLMATEIRHSSTNSTNSPVTMAGKVLTLSADSRDGSDPRVFTITATNGLTYRKGSATQTLIESDLLDPDNSFFEYVPDPPPDNNKQNIQTTLALTDTSAGSSTTTRYIIVERN